MPKVKYQGDIPRELTVAGRRGATVLKLSPGDSFDCDEMTAIQLAFDDKKTGERKWLIEKPKARKRTETKEG